MSEDENLAVVRRTIESFANDLETWLDTLDPAVKWYPQEEHQTLLLGRDAAVRRRERWRETFKEGTYGLEIQELRGNGRMCSPSSGNGAEVWGAESRLRTMTMRTGKCATGRSCTAASTGPAPKPSKPLGCRSRGCPKASQLLAAVIEA